jgi:hypothetical protein
MHREFVRAHSAKFKWRASGIGRFRRYQRGAAPAVARAGGWRERPAATAAPQEKPKSVSFRRSFFRKFIPLELGVRVK